MVVWAVVCAPAGLARAGDDAGPAPRDPAAAEVLFQEGRRLLKAGDVHGAASKLEESLRLDPAVGTLANLADCEETLGRTASAWQHWRQAADQMATRDRRRKPALARAARLEKILPRLQVTLAPEVVGPLAIERDGVRLGDASLGVPLPVNPGHHVVIVSAPERQPRRFDVVLTEKETASLVVAPGPPAVPVPPPAPAAPPAPIEVAPPALPSVRLTAAPPAPEATPLVRRLRRSDWIVLGVGAAGAGAAAVFGVQALAAREEAADLCPRRAGLTRCWSTARQPLDRDRRSSLLADVGLVAGVAAAGTAAYLLTRPRPARAEAAPRLLAGPLRGGGEVQVVGSF
jgi:hypothetical protein